MGIKINDIRDKSYFIISQPRSGSSFLSESIQQNGIDMGYLKHNNLHTMEDLDFVELNDWILDRAGGTWRNPPQQEKIDILKNDQVVSDRIKELLLSKRNYMYGAKDPRFSLTFSLYIPFLDDDVYIITIFRKPDIERNDPLKIIDQKRYHNNILKIINEFMIYNC